MIYINQWAKFMNDFSTISNCFWTDIAHGAPAKRFSICYDLKNIPFTIKAPLI